MACIYGRISTRHQFIAGKILWRNFKAVSNIIYQQWGTFTCFSQPNHSGNINIRKQNPEEGKINAWTLKLLQICSYIYFSFLWILNQINSECIVTENVEALSNIRNVSLQEHSTCFTNDVINAIQMRSFCMVTKHGYCAWWPSVGTVHVP